MFLYLVFVCEVKQGQCWMGVMFERSEKVSDCLWPEEWCLGTYETGGIVL